MKITLRKYNGNLVPANAEAREKIDSFADGAFYEVDIKNMDKRTTLQNKSQWLWFSKIAVCLNQNKAYISETVKTEVEWNKDSVKTLLFDPIIKALYGKDSSTKLNKNEYEKIIDTLVYIFANKGIVLPEFPNRESLEEITKGK